MPTGHTAVQLPPRRKGALELVLQAVHAASSRGAEHVTHDGAQRSHAPVGELELEPAGQVARHRPPSACGVAASHERQLASPAASQLAQVGWHSAQLPVVSRKLCAGQLWKQLPPTSAGRIHPGLHERHVTQSGAQAVQSKLMQSVQALAPTRY